MFIKESQSESASARKSALLGVSNFASLDMLASNERSGRFAVMVPASTSPLCVIPRRRRLRETKASRKSLICRR